MGNGYLLLRINEHYDHVALFYAAKKNFYFKEIKSASLELLFLKIASMHLWN
jgi:hypothetical protein